MKRLFWSLGLIALLCATPAWASLRPGVGGTGCESPTTVASLPTTETGQICTITDGNSATDCSTGGGSTSVVCWYDGASWTGISSGGTGEANTASNLGGGLASYDSKSGVDLRFNSFNSSDFDLVANLLSIDDATWLNEAELDSEAELEGQLADVTDVFTDNDGALNDDDLTDDTLATLSDVTAKSGNTTVVATTSGTLNNGNCVGIDANGNLVDAGGTSCTSTSVIDETATFAYDGSDVTGTLANAPSGTAPNANVQLAFTGYTLKQVTAAPSNSEFRFYDVTNCTGAGTPEACCTGTGTGNCGDTVTLGLAPLSSDQVVASYLF